MNVGAVHPIRVRNGAEIRYDNTAPMSSVIVVKSHSVISFDARIFHRRTGRVSSSLSVPSACSAETMSLPRTATRSGRRRKPAAFAKPRTNIGDVGWFGSMSWSR